MLNGFIRALGILVEFLNNFRNIGRGSFGLLGELADFVSHDSKAFSHFR